MAEFGNINVSVRTQTGKGVARTIRREGRIPGILYGSAKDNVSLTLDPHELMKATDPSLSWNTMFTLTIKDEGHKETTQTAMVSDVQVHAVRREVEHIDFMRVDPESEVIRKIPVRYEGRSAGVVKGGKLKTYRRTVRIACKPGEVPVELLVDITDVDSGESLRIQDVEMPSGRLVEPEDARLCFVDLPKSNPEGEQGGDGAAPAAEAPAEE